MASCDPSGQRDEQPRPHYVSAVRANQARATRRAIVAAAADLFVEQGYAATTIDAVAERAGVGRKTVFSSVGGKGALLKLAWDWALVGDDEPLTMSERPVVQAIVAERDSARLVRMWVEMVVDVGVRASAIGEVVLAAADVDADARELRELIRRESLKGALAFVTHLAGTGALRRGTSIEQGAETCWAVVNSLLMPLLVADRGWSTREYADWLVRVVSASLLEADQATTSPGRLLVETRDDATGQRYEARIGPRVAGHLAYARTDRLLVLLRTEVEPGVDDRGVADALVRAALDDVPPDGSLRVVAHCPYVHWWLGRHADYASLLYGATG